jgi:hypothetical protein
LDFLCYALDVCKGIIPARCTAPKHTAAMKGIAGSLLLGMCMHISQASDYYMTGPTMRSTMLDAETWACMAAGACVVMVCCSTGTQAAHVE